MNFLKRVAVLPLAAGLLAGGVAPGLAWPERGKDWFGRPHEACEPKCHWQWWLGRKAPAEARTPEQAKAGAPSPGSAPAQEQHAGQPAQNPALAPAPSPPAAKSRPALRASRPAESAKRKTAGAAPATPWPAEPADLAAIALMGVPYWDPALSDAPSEPGRRVGRLSPTSRRSW